MSKNTIDDRLKGEFVVQFGHMFLSKEDTVELRTEAFKQALYQDLIDILKKYEHRMWLDTYEDLEQSINQYFKRGEKNQ